MKREISFDVAKIIAIFMVVFGHVQTVFGMTWGLFISRILIIGDVLTSSLLWPAFFCKYVLHCEINR